MKTSLQGQGLTSLQLGPGDQLVNGEGVPAIFACGLVISPRVVETVGGVR